MKNETDKIFSKRVTNSFLNVAKFTLIFYLKHIPFKWFNAISYKYVGLKISNYFFVKW